MALADLADTDTYNTVVQRTQTPRLKGDKGMGILGVGGCDAVGLTCEKTASRLVQNGHGMWHQENPMTKKRFSFGFGDLPTDRLRPLAGIQRTFTCLPKTSHESPHARGSSGGTATLIPSTTGTIEQRHSRHAQGNETQLTICGIKVPLCKRR